MKLVLVTAVPARRLSDMPQKYCSGSVTVNNTSKDQVKVIYVGRCESRVWCHPSLFVHRDGFLLLSAEKSNLGK